MTQCSRTRLLLTRRAHARSARKLPSVRADLRVGRGYSENHQSGVVRMYVCIVLGGMTCPVLLLGPLSLYR